MTEENDGPSIKEIDRDPHRVTTMEQKMLLSQILREGDSWQDQM